MRPWSAQSRKADIAFIVFLLALFAAFPSICALALELAR